MPAVVLGPVVAVGARSAAPRFPFLGAAVAALDVQNGGPASIGGVVTQQGVPARKQVVLIAWPELQRVASTVSATDGAYSFVRLRRREYLVVGVDETRTLDPEAKLVVAS